MKTPIKTILLLVALALGLALFIGSFFWLSRVYLSLTAAFVLAYLLDPLVSKLESHKIKRSLSAPIVLILFFTVIVVSGIAVTPKLFAQGRELLLRLPRAFQLLSDHVAPISQRLLGYNILRDFDAYLPSVSNQAASLAEPLSGIVGGVFTASLKVVMRILGLLIIPLMAYYVLVDLPRFYPWFLSFLPKRYHKEASVLRDRMTAVLGGFFRGQLVVSSVLSVYYASALSVLGLDLSVVLGVVAGILNIVPYLGITTALLLSFGVAMLHGFSTARLVALAAIFALGMIAEGSFLTPRIVGSRVGLRPLNLILALLIGGELLGLTGMLLAVPAAAILKVIFDHLIDKYRDSETFKRV